jgi:hypothetical protein
VPLSWTLRAPKRDIVLHVSGKPGQEIHSPYPGRSAFANSIYAGSHVASTGVVEQSVTISGTIGGKHVKGQGIAETVS